jgi:hypothetical protein
MSETRAPEPLEERRVAFQPQEKPASAASSRRGAFDDEDYNEAEGEEPEDEQEDLEDEPESPSPFSPASKKKKVSLN